MAPGAIYNRTGGSIPAGDVTPVSRQSLRMAATAKPTPAVRPGPSWMQLAVVAVLAGLAGGVLVLWAQSGPAEAMAQPTLPMTSSAGVVAVPAQLSREGFGLYLVDTAQGTVMVYAYDASRRQLGLQAARTFRFDRLLEAYNTEPSPGAIAEMVRQARPIEGP